MNRNERILEIARIESRDSQLRVKLGAALVRGRRVIKLSTNSLGKPRFVGSWTRHAEVNATINVDATGGVVYVAREHRLYRSPMLAKPCNHCVEWLQYVGVEKVVYTIPEYPYYEEMTL